MENPTEQDPSNDALLNGLMGRALVNWHVGDGGMHFALDDGRIVIFSGVFAIAVMQAEENVLH